MKVVYNIHPENVVACMLNGMTILMIDEYDEIYDVKNLEVSDMLKYFKDEKIAFFTVKEVEDQYGEGEGYDE